MVRPRILKPQSIWDQAAVLQAFQEHGVKPVHAIHMWNHLLRNPDSHWSSTPDFPKAATELLDKEFTKITSTVADCKRSADGETTKLLINLQDERYSMEPDEPPCSSNASTAGAINGKGNRRATLCVSSQVGCQMACAFCATGTMGLKGNLAAAEILEQLVHARRVTLIRNIVFMGMGEPLNNYDAVKAAIAMMTDSRFFSLSRKHVTVSTVGIIPRIKQLSQDLPGVSLALSLHAPTQELRAQIVPSARAYKLDRLMEAVQQYQQQSGQRVFVEYVVLAGVNDGTEQAHQLGQLLQGADVVINLIPWNPIYSPDGPAFAAPSQEAVAEMHQILRSQYGLHTTVRQEKGQDISGACGQLVIEQAAAASLSKTGCSTEADGGSCNTTARGLKDIEDISLPRAT